MKLLFIGAIYLVALFYMINSQITNGRDESQNTITITNQSSTNKNGHFSTNVYKDIYSTAKNISHSKGPIIMRDTDGTPEYRRSLIRKIEKETHSLALKKVLNVLENCTDEELISTFESLKYLVHEYDIAIGFMNIEGLKIIIPYILSEDENIASAALSILSTAMQGNPVVQKVVTNNEVWPTLLSNLNFRGEKYLSSLLFTMSSFLRNNPGFQLHFLKNDGIIMLSRLIQSSHSQKLKLHASTILADLSTEMFEEAGLDYQKKQLLEVFIDGVQSTNICKKLPELLYTEENTLNVETILSEYRINEKVIHAINELQQVCVQDFQTTQVQTAIHKYIQRYDPENETSPLAMIDEELKISIYLQFKNFYKQMYSEKKKVNEEL